MEDNPESANESISGESKASDGAVSGQSKTTDQSKMTDQIKTTSGVGQALTTAADFVISSAVLAGLGVWSGTKLDEWLHSAPWFTVGLALVGVTLGMVRMVMKASATEKK